MSPSTRYHVITIKGDKETQYRIYDQKHRRYFRRAFRTLKDVMFFLDILNKADAQGNALEFDATKLADRTTEALPDAKDETKKKEDDND